MALQPWYKVVTPREDLRNDRPLDASEFAVHLDAVRDDRGPDVYRVPKEFFHRTFLTKNLLTLASEAVRRLNGEITETSAVFNMATQFGGGKTHALTLLYHLATHGPASHKWPGVQQILDAGSMRAVPKTNTAVFVGTEFDAVRGRGGDDGTPLRKTPWGEIAFQLGHEKGFSVVEKHDAEGIAPGGDVIRELLPHNEPCLILMDELMNFISRYRKLGMATQLYNFLHNLSETVRGRNNVVLVVSIPASLLEMSQDDEEDFKRYKKVLDRLGKPILMAEESETAEIIRRRLFEWDHEALGSSGRVNLSRDALDVCRAYADWVVDHRQQVPGWFPVDQGFEVFKSSYPFHPMTLSVFERKWQTLPRFQKTRGVLRMLALWVARAYQDGYKGAHRDMLIGPGTAPLDDSMFRSVVFEQLGDPDLEPAITADICGRADSHAVRLDEEAVEAIKKSRLHRKAATSILFESNGGMSKDEDATVPEIRLALGEPTLDTGNVDTVLDTLGGTCYYLTINRNRFRFSLRANLNKMLADRRANVDPKRIAETVRAEVQKVFAANDPAYSGGIERRFFPEKSNDIPNKPILTLAVLAPENSMAEKSSTLALIDTITKECGSSGRTYKSAIVWCVPDNMAGLTGEARNLLAWEEIRDDETSKLDEHQEQQLDEAIKRARRDLREAVWRTYRFVALLDKDNTVRVSDLGLVNSSMAQSLSGLVLQQLKKDGELESSLSPNFVSRHWPAQTEWSTKGLRDACFASPRFPRLLNGEQAVKEMVARGVQSGSLAYVGKSLDGTYDPFHFGDALSELDVEISDEMYVIRKDAAEAYKRRQSAPPASPVSAGTSAGPSAPSRTNAVGPDSESGPEQPEFPPVPGIRTGIKTLRWRGQVPAQKWMNFYTKVLSKHASSGALEINLDVAISPKDGVSQPQVDEIRIALRELGLDDQIGSDDS